MKHTPRPSAPGMRLGFSVLVLFGAWAAVAPAAQPGAKQTALVVRDASVAPAVFAAGEIRDALEAVGFRVKLAGPDAAPGGEPLRIVVAVAGSPPAERLVRQKDAAAAVGPLGPQAYAIRKTASGVRVTWWAIGGDAAGAMYAGLDVAEMIRLGKGPDAIGEKTCKPHIARRGIKFNIPLDARTPSYDDTGDAAQQNYAVMWDFAFWQEFLDGLARHRYNTLTLWNPHPFPSLVKLPDYPDVALEDVCVITLKPTYKSGAWRDPMFAHPEVFDHLKVVRRMTIDEKIAFWRRVMQHARDRGIDVYFITWNVLVNGTRGKYGITDAQDNPKTIAYMRQCVEQLVLTYPLLAGIGATAGEHMKARRDEFSKEKWLWKTYGLGVLDAKRKQPGRKVAFLHRVWQTGVGEVMREFGSKYPDRFELGFKYARAHMYSSPRPPFADKLCEEMKPYGVRCWWNLRNDDIFNFRWGDPDYVRAFLANLPPEELTAGYHMGSDGYVWGREFTSLQPDRPRKLEIEKHWYKFMLWGRLGYDPTLDRAFFEKVLADRFPQAPTAAMYDAWQAASRIIPQVNRFHWRNWDFMWAVEGCLDQRKGFHTVDDFINNPTMQRSGILTIPEYVEARLASRSPNAITPGDVADQLKADTDRTLALVALIRQKALKPEKELRHTLDDLKAMAHLGNYYAAKIRGAVELHTFRKSKAPKHRKSAVGHLSEAVDHWRRYAEVASAQYRPQLLARTRRLDWMGLLEEVKRDVEIARAAPDR